MRKVKCSCTDNKQCKHCYDAKRRSQIKNGSWSFKKEMPNALSKDQEEILIGGLLGDLYLYQNKNHINAGIASNRALKDLEYSKFEYESFKEFCNSGIKNKQYFDTRTNKIYYGVYFRTRVSEIFTPYKKKWYPNGIKIVPRDLKLSPLICAIWFCDDGSVIRLKNSLKLQLSTDGFKKEEVEFLASLLKKEIDAEFNVYAKESHYVIHAAHEATIKFINYITPYFPKSMKRKSDKWKDLV